MYVTQMSIRWHTCANVMAFNSRTAFYQAFKKRSGSRLPNTGKITNK
ncbi:MAG: hypothetical protein LIP01_09545 [Tannerellaceae bacterium]|nr:hypothetical protein [Tannerellaceae bacterium]